MQREVEFLYWETNLLRTSSKYNATALPVVILALLGCINVKLRQEEEERCRPDDNGLSIGVSKPNGRVISMFLLLLLYFSSSLKELWAFFLKSVFLISYYARVCRSRTGNRVRGYNILEIGVTRAKLREQLFGGKEFRCPVVPPPPSPALRCNYFISENCLIYSSCFVVFPWIFGRMSRQGLGESFAWRIHGNIWFPPPPKFEKRRNKRTSLKSKKTREELNKRKILSRRGGGDRNFAYY